MASAKGRRLWVAAVATAFGAGALASWRVLRQARNSVSADNEPLSHAEMQKLDDGVYLSEVRKQQAAAITRTRDAADRSWKIAATFAGVIIATGFTDKLRAAPRWVQALGAGAIGAWLMVTALFIWVNNVPAVGSPKWKPYSAREEQKMKLERDAAQRSGDRVRQREVDARVAMRTGLALVGHRFAVASVGTVLALVISGAALTTAGLVGARSTAIRGRPQLTTEGQTALVAACPKLDQQSAKNITARFEADLIGADKPVALRFTAGVCADQPVTVYVSGKLITGFASA